MRTNYFKHAQELAERVSSSSPFYNYKVQRRNGYVAVDYFSKDGRYLDYLQVGTAKEIDIYLRGMIHFAWQNTRPF